MPQPATSPIRAFTIHPRLAFDVSGRTKNNSVPGRRCLKTNRQTTPIVAYCSPHDSLLVRARFSSPSPCFNRLPSDSHVNTDSRVRTRWRCENEFCPLPCVVGTDNWIREVRSRSFTPASAIKQKITLNRNQRLCAPLLCFSCCLSSATV